MLVLTRKKDEQIRIGDDIIITVIRVKGKSVRLGIQAPRTEPVLRGELEFREPSGSTQSPPAAASYPATLAREALAAREGSKHPLRDFLATNLTGR